MLRYSDRALSIRPRFFYPYNDVTFIVEDLDDEQFYTNLFQCLFAGELRVGRVLGLGGKAAVIQRFKERSTIPGRTNEFLVVDGDFDELLGVSVTSDVRLYRLPSGVQ